MYSVEQLYKIYLQHPKVITDSRQIEPGCLFFALKGERFNGNEFALDAIKKGAAYAIIDEKKYDVDDRCLLVEDVLSTLQALASHHRQQFYIPVIAITGSNGKTTTKELVNAVLSSHYRAHCTKGNFNNLIGLPLTLLAMPTDTEVAIIEMGANHIGEIDDLCRIADPTHGLITNVGKAHLEGFGSFEGVRQAKSELYRYLGKKNGVVFVNQDEPYLAELSLSVNRRIFYRKGKNPNSNHLPFEVQLTATEPCITIAFSPDFGDPLTVCSQLIGEYNFNNLMTAAVLGTYFKVPGHKVKLALESYVSANNRSQVVRQKTNTFILDAYNANPTSMKNALDAFGQMKAGRKIVIMGAMRELGKFSDREHREILAHSMKAGFDHVIVVGPEFRQAAEKFDTPYFENTAALSDWFQGQDFTDTHFLIKGSRSIGLEKLVQ